METLLGLAKAIPPDVWLVVSVLASAVVMGLHWVIAHLMGRDGVLEESGADTHADSDRELLGS